MDLSNAQQLICVEYPGKVVNDDRALETLGGINEISQTFCSDKAKLHLKFRPNNVYAKAIIGDRTVSSGVLLKVKVKRRGNEIKTENVQVIGTSDVTYKFDRMCDYEMLPLVKRTPGSSSAELIYSDIIPTIDETKDSWLQNPKQVPYFFLPQVFTRVDGGLTERRIFKDGATSTRQKRVSVRGAIRLEFNLSDPIPTAPKNAAILNQKNQEETESIRAKFKERPVWSLNALMAQTKMPRVKFQSVLPSIAYFYQSGPWRNQWLLFGYDPRKDFASRMYQVMMVRLNKKAVFNIKTRSQVRKSTAPGMKKRNIVSQLVYDEEETTPAESEESYMPIFGPGHFHHLSFANAFQYCDIEVPKVQEMLQQVPSPEHGGKCLEKWGWLPVGFDEQVRNILIDILKEHFQMEMQAKLQDESMAMQLVDEDGEYDEEEEQEEEMDEDGET